jgi:hypothetical protein
MSDDPEEPENKAGELQPPKKKAEENSWYLLATLYGVPRHQDKELKDKNRRAWNKYYAERIDLKTREFLVTEKGYSAEELTPFSQEEGQEVKQQFNVSRKLSIFPQLQPACCPPKKFYDA